MAQHFLLSAAARSLSLAKVMRMSDTAVENVFLRLRWPDTDGKPVCLSNRIQIRPLSLSIVTPLAGADVACVGLFVTGTELWVSGLPERPSRVWRRQATYP